MQDAWLAFARDGRPAAAGLDAWPAYDEDRRATMVLGARCGVSDSPYEHERRFWDGLL
jgi:para-nitrobenzyl esterase